MTTLLSDHNMEGHAALLFGAIAADGWLDLVPIQIVTFTDAGLPPDSSDRTIWRFVQASGMLLLTGNRNMDDEDSLERVMREEGTIASLPVLTIGSLRRLADRDYRQRFAERVVEVVLDLDRYLGRRRTFIP